MRRQSRLLLISVTFLLLAASCGLSLAGAAEQAAYYPGKLRIQKGKNLAPQEREVEARFAKYLEDHTEKAIALYQEKYGKEINTDNARELSRDYAPGGIEADDPKTIAARAIWSNAVYEPASALAREIYRRELKKPAGKDKLTRVVFTAGGAGAGKTTSIRAIPGIAHAVEFSQIVYDTTLSSLRSAIERITQALEAGKTVSIVYVYRDPVESFVAGALPRAQRMGRTLPLEVLLQTHIGSAKVLLDLAERYRDDPRVGIAVIDNSRGGGEAVVADVKFVKRVAAKYSPGELRAKLLQALEDAYEKGRRGEKDGISEAVYRGFKGNAP